MRWAGVFLVLGFLGLPEPVLGQTTMPQPATETEHTRYLVLDRNWPFKRMRFYPGEKLAFKLRHETGWNRGTIQAVTKNSLVILDAEIPFTEIRKLRVARNDYTGGFMRLTSGSLIGGGALWIALGGINELDGKAGSGKWLAGAGAGAILLGFATRELTRHTWRVGRNYRLKSI